jgi:4-amino-4-deoxy-L-arabinose transferase-like glycosyltransferase
VLSGDAILDRFWRHHQIGPVQLRIDLYWLLGLGAVLIGVGLGLRDPWPADEPRFALVAREMVRTGQWLFPQIGGDWYADKPPLFFWLIASCYALLGSLRVAFLLPSLLAALATVALVYDLARRVWSREVGLAAGWLLLVTFQFVWQGRQAQIDALLCFWITLSLYGLLRHLLLGPAWRWYCIGFAAAGFGIVTKGVGFLSLLVLVLYAGLRWRGWGGAKPWHRRYGYWALGPLVLVLCVSLWLLPMLWFADTPELAAYRDEILFHQTVDRYANAWHHHEPFWYYLVEVIPPLWLPLSALLPWLWPRWRQAFRERDLSVILPLLWVVGVVLFFSVSPGKRGVYLLPALPALVWSSAPFFAELLRRPGVQRLFFGWSVVLAAVPALVVLYVLVRPTARHDVIAQYGVDPLGPLCLMAVLAGTVCVLCRRRVAMAYVGALGALLLVVGLWVNPAINAARSGAQFVAQVEAAVAPTTELGLVAYKEQYLLRFTRPTVNFGHARWREAQAEAADAAVWLAQARERVLLLPDAARQQCFANTSAQSMGKANGAQWFLVSGPANPTCLASGTLAAARSYRPEPPN